MNDEEIRAVRKIRHEISAEFGHDIHKVVAYYRTVEDEMRRSGEFHFVDASEAPRRRAEATSTIALVTSANA